MRTFLTTPAWALGLITGVPVAVVTATLVAISGDTVTFALVLGGIVGALFGTAMAGGAVRQRRDLRPIFDQLPPSDWNLARTAARRGPAPTEPAVRTAAVALIDVRLRQQRRVRILLTVIFGINLVVAVVNIALGDWWYVPLAVIWIAALIEQWATPRRLRRRRELLTAQQTLP
ncbi:hypothetical protein [Kribbella lupini]|uniref:Sensor protein n=1 Tax=Kribbella lupini TaxID=291602 RepID=A0ABN2BNU1_9ACTN